MNCPCQQFGAMYMSQFISDENGRTGIKCEYCGDIRWASAMASISVTEAQAKKAIPDHNA